jgi:hypothetical protein
MRVGGGDGAARAHGPGLPTLPLPHCGKQFNERSGGLLNRTQDPSDVIALVVLWRLRHKLALRDLPEMFLVRGLAFGHEAAREWEAKLTPALAEALRRRRRGKADRSWHVDETSRSRAAGAISTGPSTAPARWSICSASSRQPPVLRDLRPAS